METSVKKIPVHPAPSVIPEAVSVDEAARRAGVSRAFLYERLASGELPSARY